MLTADRVSCTQADGGNSRGLVVPAVVVIAISPPDPTLFVIESNERLKLLVATACKSVEN